MLHSSSLTKAAPSPENCPYYVFPMGKNLLPVYCKLSLIVGFSLAVWGGGLNINGLWKAIRGFKSMLCTSDAVKLHILAHIKFVQEDKSGQCRLYKWIQFYMDSVLIC